MGATAGATEEARQSSVGARATAGASTLHGVRGALPAAQPVASDAQAAALPPEFEWRGVERPMGCGACACVARSPVAVGWAAERASEAPPRLHPTRIAPLHESGCAALERLCRPRRRARQVGFGTGWGGGWNGSAGVWLGRQEAGAWGGTAATGADQKAASGRLPRRVPATRVDARPAIGGLGAARIPFFWPRGRGGAPAAQGAPCTCSRRCGRQGDQWRLAARRGAPRLLLVRFRRRTDSTQPPSSTSGGVLLTA